MDGRLVFDGRNIPLRLDDGLAGSAEQARVMVDGDELCCVVLFIVASMSCKSQAETQQSSVEPRGQLNKGAIRPA